MPQLFAIMTEFENEMNNMNSTKFESNLCGMIEYKVNKTEQIVRAEGQNEIHCEPVSSFW